MSNMINVGLPSKKRNYDLMVEEGVGGDCLLDSRVLVLLYNEFLDEDTKRSSIKLIDLDAFDGDEKNIQDFLCFENKNILYVRSADKDNILLLGERNIVIRRSGNNVQAFSEFDEDVPSEWSISFSAFVVGGLYYRQLDRANPESGMDVYDLDTRSVVSHFDFDFVTPSYIGFDLIVGKRESGNFAIYSMKDRAFVSEFCSESYFNCSSESKLDFYFSLFENQLAVARNDSVLIVELENFNVIHRVQPLLDEKFKPRLENHQGTIKDFIIEGVSFANGRVVVHGSRYFPFLICIECGEEANVSWVYNEGGAIQSKYIGGNLIFGIEASRPVAWDVISGENVWQADSSTIANKIQIGERWLVYSQFSGYVQCFCWDAPYVSELRSHA